MGAEEEAVVGQGRLSALATSCPLLGGCMAQPRRLPLINNTSARSDNRRMQRHQLAAAQSSTP